MPRLDQTGPLSEGPMTGGGRGLCSGVGAGQGRRRGRCRFGGRGFGSRRRVADWPDELEAMDVKAALEQRRDTLERSLKAINSRLNAIEKEPSNGTVPEQ